MKGIKMINEISFEAVARMTELCPPAGVYKDMPAAQYHAIDALNNSTLAEFCKSGMHGREYLRGITKPSAAMLFGSAFHSALLEPNDFAMRMHIDETIGPAAEVRHANVQAEYPDAIILRNGWIEIIEQIASNIGEHTAATHLMQEVDGKNELTMIWTIDRVIDGKTVSVPCKARADRFIPAFVPIAGMGEVSCLVDLKTTRDASPHAFEHSIASLGYHRQAAWYLTGAIACGLMDDFHDFSYIIIACEKSSPNIVATYPIAAAALQQGMGELKSGLAAYIKYRLHGHAPMPSDVLMPLAIPNWAMNPHNEVGE